MIENNKFIKKIINKNKDSIFVKRLKAAYKAYFSVEDTKKNVKVSTKVTINDNPVTVNDLKHEYCCGCGACSNICPFGAIAMSYDSQGYLYPVIDESKCTNCGLCAKTCPVINTPKDNKTAPECYAVMAKDKIRKESSSGGMFTVLAEHVLNNGGCVCGVALNEKFVAEHIIIDSAEQLEKLRGSKYVQADTNDVFTRIKKLLNEGRQVLFTGTPCQVAGLNNFLKKKYDNLIMVDLVCHGAPSIKVFHKYLEEYYGMENLSEFKFRTKEFGYSSFNQTATLKDGTKISGNIKFDAYERTMHTGLAIKDVCGDCMFAPAPRQGDISIGDFWGIKKYKEEYGDRLGTSCVLINNEKGAELFEQVKDKVKMCEPVPFSHARNNNRFGRTMKIPAGRKWFFNMLEKQPIDKVVEYSLKGKYDVGVIGLWYGRNYGSMATYYALHYVLKQMGLSVLMIENSLKPVNETKITKTHPRRIADEYYDVSEKYPLDELYKLNAICDSFIVGSDQLWNVGLSRPYKQTYFLDFVDVTKKKIAYATSFGKPYKGRKEELLISSENLRKFDYVSVRDELSKNICKNRFKVDAVRVCDPAFLCPMEGYEELVSKAQLQKKDDYILAYILDPKPEFGKVLEKISTEKKCKIKVLLDEPDWLWKKNVEKLALSGAGDIEIEREVDLNEWLWYYKHADAVVTDSFHGTIYSIIYKKPFVTLSNAKRGKQRFVSLLNPIGLMNRLVFSVEAIGEKMSLLDGMDYVPVYEKLNKIKRRSRNWLRKAIFAPKKVKAHTVYPSWDERLDKNDENVQ